MSVETEALEYYRKLVSLIYREVGSIQPENRRELYQKSKIGVYPSIESSLKCQMLHRVSSNATVGEEVGLWEGWLSWFRRSMAPS